MLDLLVGCEKIVHEPREAKIALVQLNLKNSSGSDSDLSGPRSAVDFQFKALFVQGIADSKEGLQIFSYLIRCFFGQIYTDGTIN
jgi:hypothetical protein